MDLEFIDFQSGEWVTAEEALGLSGRPVSGHYINCSHTAQSRHGRWCVYVFPGNLGNNSPCRPIHCCDKCGPQVIATGVALEKELKVYTRLLSDTGWGRPRIITPKTVRA